MLYAGNLVHTGSADLSQVITRSSGALHSASMQAIHTKAHAKIASVGKRRSPSSPPLRMMAVILL